MKASPTLLVEGLQELLEGLGSRVHDPLDLRAVGPRLGRHGLQLLGAVEDSIVGVLHVLGPLGLALGEDLGSVFRRVV